MVYLACFVSVSGCVGARWPVVVFGFGVWLVCLLRFVGWAGGGAGGVRVHSSVVGAGVVTGRVGVYFAFLTMF